MDGITVAQRRRKRLDGLITLGVSDTVAFIQELTDTLQGATSSRECLERNKTALYQWVHKTSNVKLRKKDVMVLHYRVASMLDMLSPQDTARLASAIVHLDRRLALLYSPLVDQYCDMLEQGLEGAEDDTEMLVSTALMLTSIEIMIRVQSQQDKSIQGSGSRYRVKPQGRESCEMPQIEQGYAAGNNLFDPADSSQAPHQCMYDDNIADDEAYIFKQALRCGQLIASRLARYLEEVETVDLELMILLAQVLGNISIPVATVSETVFRKIDVNAVNETQLCEFIYACALAMDIHKVDIEDVMDECMAKLSKRSIHNDLALDTSGIAKAFHAFYLTGKLDAELMGTLANHILSNKVTFENNADFYRIAIPLAIIGQLSSQDICQWVLTQLASNVEELSKDRSHFLFLLTSIANNIRVVWKPRSKLPLHAVALETDIYEKAEMFLRQQDGEKNYFPSTRAAVLHLIETANSFIKTSSSDEFVQILLLNCVRNFKPDSRVRFELLNECKRRVNEITCGGIPQVLQTLFTLFSPNAPELIEALTIYLDRVLAEITTYNSASTKQIDGSRLFSLTFMQDINLLGNVLSVFDRCNLNRGDLAAQVIEMLERSSFQQLETAENQTLIDVLHYLAFSLDQHDAIDVIAILLQRRLQQGTEFSAGQLAAIAECFIAAPMALNPLRHKGLTEVIRQKATESKGEVKALKKILSKVG
ncbi:uncharacterized protein BXIN_3066 [Babesia sp. Xinjiang]|uniref:uncharacterized protein n=1 Tax=Babesia sp. Xinjiang TaxID=462227 RepID=UPI000A26005B|nr:uncharacterized protein BXIN_3066 [Babesia sp. Xinjiang]ORM39354.1 hypothetical protein BXIN_3066 [Babesia sp. Xinjiang]